MPICIIASLLATKFNSGGTVLIKNAPWLEAILLCQGAFLVLLLK